MTLYTSAQIQPSAQPSTAPTIHGGLRIQGAAVQVHIRLPEAQRLELRVDVGQASDGLLLAAALGVAEGVEPS